MVLSAAFHICVIAGLLWALKPPLAAHDPPISEVALFPSSFGAGAPNVKLKPDRPEPPKARPAPPDRRALAAASIIPFPLPADESSKPTPSSPAPAGDLLAPSLRLALGCRHADFLALSETERARCRSKLAQGRETAADVTGFGVSPNAKAAFDRGAARERILTTPFLSSMPKKGCKPMLTEREAGVYGKSQPDFTVAVGCGVPF